ncbi:MAG: hypothetical protein ACW963_08795 [Candidatus Sifarchaeia archaeon]
MSLIPAFELGLWNAWIFWLYYVIQIVPMMLIYRYVWKDDWKKVGGLRVTSPLWLGFKSPPVHWAGSEF